MKKNFIDIKDDFVASLNRQKKLTAIILVVTILFIISLFIIVPKVQANIRASEIKSLVNQEKLTKKANYLDAKIADKEISEKTARTVLFSVPSGKAYGNVIDVLKDSKQMKDFNHSIYIYPIVYDAQIIENKYNIKKNEVTIIFFENGKEKNRISIDERFDTKKMLIPALNQLPLSSIGQSIQPPASSMPASTETTQTTTESQVTVDSEQTVE
ncbi:hypothetical protein UAW_01292 [Enterococcus haemoperoxidus ATCC BAA-382]|uniref:Uncharacterized protein n=1 Tax=Enterococcus haemoperoxidus ATCC BAA-382 TaxID=1158608 RepID=R2T0W0_9ENTE|nr:hypothetical protein [Enterococcus haemoperoxidus]EOH98696.1 hypothetical protein UAW_01292 [Enterococcus haemoperoxidus ATCC BAA-382]EOT62121.1 hypothetical protein I583_01121 [Enterococcus haemoperoxidus ATCC BAA-382]OJG55797.1 hypothetical protein RV06_GL001379 [Enterococcus haemoperoxidus]